MSLKKEILQKSNFKVDQVNSLIEEQLKELHHATDRGIEQPVGSGVATRGENVTVNLFMTPHGVESRDPSHQTREPIEKEQQADVLVVRHDESLSDKRLLSVNRIAHSYNFKYSTIIIESTTYQ